MSWAAFGMGALNTLVSNLSNAYGSGKWARNKQQEEEHDLYLRREREGIQNRIEGAKAAGLHPLVGLGYQSGPGPSTVIGADPIVPYESSHMQRQPEKEAPDPDIARYNKARADLAELDVVAAQKKLSEVRLGTQPGQPIGVMAPTSDANLVKGRIKPGVKIVPDEVTAGVGGLTAGTHQGGSSYQFKGVPGSINLMGEKAAEATEELGALQYWLTYQMNKDRVNNFLADLFGLSQLNFDANMSRQRAAEKREVNLETIRLKNRSRASQGYR